MKFLRDLATQIEASASYYWGEFTRNLPFRMTIGRFGIWLMKVGRFLQVRYANWNSEFRLEREFHPNPQYCTIHVSDPVTEESILSFDSPNAQLNKITPMVSALFGVKGVMKVTIQRYEIGMLKAGVYFLARTSARDRGDRSPPSNGENVTMPRAREKAP